MQHPSEGTCCENLKENAAFRRMLIYHTELTWFCTVMHYHYSGRSVEPDVEVVPHKGTSIWWVENDPVLNLRDYKQIWSSPNVL